LLLRRRRRSVPAQIQIPCTAAIHRCGQRGEMAEHREVSRLVYFESVFSVARVWSIWSYA
jgi:hypothetical protein